MIFTQSKISDATQQTSKLADLYCW